MAQVTPATLAAINAAVRDAGPAGGVSSGAISAFNWARWEYMLNVTRRKDRWRAALGKQVKGSHVVIYDTTPRRRKQCEYRFLYGGPITERLATQQAQVNAYFAAALWTRMEKLIYSETWVRRPRWARGDIKLDYHERATRWHMSNMTGLGRLPSGTSLSEPGTSRREGNKSKRGWLSKTPRKSMA